MESQGGLPRAGALQGQRLRRAVMVVRKKKSSIRYDEANEILHFKNFP